MCDGWRRSRVSQGMVDREIGALREHELVKIEGMGMARRPVVETAVAELAAHDIACQCLETGGIACGRAC